MPYRRPGGGGGTPIPDYLVTLNALYNLATDAGATNTMPRFASDEPRLEIPGLTSGWVVARNADRYVEMVIDVPDTGAPGATSLAIIGTYSGTNALGILRTDGTGWAWYSPNWVSNVRVGATFAAWRNQRVYVGVFYDHSAAQFTIYVRIGAGAQTSYTLALANAGASTADLVYPGGNISNIASTAGMAAVWMANYTSDPGDAHRDAVQALVTA